MRQIVVVARALAVVIATSFLNVAWGETPAESRFLTAREAAREGDRNAMEELVSQTDGHPLDSYVRYWLLSNGLAKSFIFTPEREVSQFLSDEAGSLLAERLRADWLRRLAKDEQWQRFLQVYPGLQNPDNELRCMAWNARLSTGDRQVLNEVARAWPALTFAHAACTPVMRAAMDQGRVGTEEVWQLFRRRVDTRSPSRARTVLGWMGESNTKAFDQAVRTPKRTLDRLPAKFANTRSGREMVMVAITRLARDDVAAAHARFQRVAGRLTPSERAYMWGVLALHAAQDHRSDAPAWFRNAGNTPMSVTQRAWRVRASLRAEDWQGVLAAIDALNPEERALPEWVYWRARALKSLRRTAEAERGFRSVASIPNFYGILANEELGQVFDPRAAYTAPSTATLDVAAQAAAEESAEETSEASEGTDPDSEEMAEVPASAPVPTNAPGPSVDKQPGFQRALALFQLDLRMDAIREWNWTLRGRDEAFRLAAAKLALNNHLYDRAITSAELANPAGAWEWRFLTPYRELIEPRARVNHLDLSWVYGIMRQESRFIIPSRSPTGAQGLMQVMPATGKYVAKKLGLYYHPGLLRDPETNVEIGTGYMRMILDELEENHVLAAAGYNAGPGRARRWRAARPLEGAIYIETIPFEETRDYVKHVMSNTAIYAALIEGKPQSLKARLGTILPKMMD